MEITVNTKLIPVIGKPMGQSLSAKMGNRIYQAHGYDYYRFPIEIDLEDLPHVLNGLKHMNVSGIGITKPYKVEVMKYLDEIDPLAVKIGAVNSVWVVEKRLIGRNIDGEAFIRSLLQETDCDLRELRCLCLGAGGAGRSICITLATRGAAHIAVGDKFPEAAQRLTDDINRDFPGVAETVQLEDKAAVQAAVSGAKLLMNVSGVGMYPNVTATPLDQSLFRPEHIAFDATYNPRRTQFLKDAEKAGCQVFTGKGMIINCGMMGFEQRTGEKADPEEWSAVFDQLLAEASGK